MMRNALFRQGNHQPITVLVVDDSLFMRTMLSDLLHSDPQFTVVATASRGSEAIRKVAQLRPDCVLLDLVMPELDGLLTLKLIMAAHPTPVIIVSAHCSAGAPMTDRCRAAGAAAIIQKPSGEISLDIDTIRSRIISEIRKVVARNRAVRRHQRFRARTGRDVQRTLSSGLIAIGGSTGGQLVLEDILCALPVPFCTPILVLQHFPNDVLTDCFVDRLNRNCPLPAKIAEDGEIPQSGVIYVAPGGAFLEMKANRSWGRQFPHSGRLLHPNPVVPSFTIYPAPKETLTPSIDRALESIAMIYGSDAVAVILSGLGADGLDGIRAIKEQGGKTVVQDGSAMILEMPKTVIDAGLADEVLPPQEIAARIAMVPCS